MKGQIVIGLKRKQKSAVLWGFFGYEGGDGCSGGRDELQREETTCVHEDVLLRKTGKFYNELFFCESLQ